MKETSEAFLKRLLATFKVEAEEHIHAFSAGLIAAEQATDEAHRQEVLEVVFREIHSLKGAARAVGQNEIERLCQAGESVLASLKSGEVSLSAELLDVLHTSADELERLLSMLNGAPASERSAVNELCRRLAAAARTQTGVPPREATAGEPASEAPVQPTAPDQTLEVAANTPEVPPPPADMAPEPADVPGDHDPVPDEHAQMAPPERLPVHEPAATIRVQVGRLDAVHYQAEALVGSRLAIRALQGDLSEARTAFARQQRDRSKWMPDLRLLQRALDRKNGTPAGTLDIQTAAQIRRLIGYLADEENFFKGFEGRLSALERSTAQKVRAFSSQLDGLLDDLKQALMLPISSVLEGLAKLVRDLSRDQGKDVAFVTRGGGLEIDRRVLDEMRDPLIHLVRNSVDHGIELPDVRAKRGKPRRASLELTARAVEGGRVEILITDDGAGVDVARLRVTAKARGMQVPDDDEAALGLMFESGITTSALVTDISGRGLGLAIVREKIERLGGSVTVTTRAGIGTAFRVVLPLTLTTFRGVRVRAGGEDFIFPSMGLERVLRVRREEIRTMENREMFRLDGQAVALARLADVLGLQVTTAPPLAMIPAVVCGKRERRMAFLVDEVVGEQEVLVKNLGRQLRRVRNIAGATVLGSGQVVPVLYLPDLLDSARQVAPAARKTPSKQAAKRKSILVAEDSITSRTLLKGILEAAGYRVVTAVDGVDAFNRLHAENFDLLVSDVDMPRMSGFDLVTKVRADRKLADLPVVMVTSLDSRQNRQRGADAGANAYIVKSGFEQGNLLATIRRLL